MKSKPIYLINQQQLSMLDLLVMFLVLVSSAPDIIVCGIGE